MLCFRIVPVAKIVMDEKGEHQNFPSIIFFVSQCQKASGGNPSVLCLRKTPVAKNFI